MVKPSAVAVVAAALLCAGSSPFAQTAGRGLPPLESHPPGRPTEARVRVLNQGATEAVPVSLERAPGDPLAVRVVSLPPVAIDRAARVRVDATVARQRWEYRRITLPANADPVPPLDGAGADGWEAVFTLPAPDGVVVVLKRPRVSGN